MTKLTAENSKSTATTAVKTDVPARDPVALRTTWMYGWPVEVDIIELTSPSVDMIVIVMRKPII